MMPSQLVNSRMVIYYRSKIGRIDRSVIIINTEIMKEVDKYKEPYRKRKGFGSNGHGYQISYDNLCKIKDTLVMAKMIDIDRYGNEFMLLALLKSINELLKHKVPFFRISEDNG